jgi:hypothetical protein
MAKEQWQLNLEATYGLPIEQVPGTVYSLCYDPPFVVRSVSSDYAATPPEITSYGFNSATPLRHYVGWTQAEVRRRLYNHHPAKTPVTVTISEGTLPDEEQMKHTGTCPTCGHPFAESLVAR